MQTILVSMTLEADSPREAEKILDSLLINAQDDDRLVEYAVVVQDGAVLEP